MEKNYNGVHWNTEDLDTCKQAVLVLIRKGIPVTEITRLDFGSLWVEAVLEECGLLP